MDVRDALCALLDHSRNRRVFASVALVAFLLTGCSTNASWLVDPALPAGELVRVRGVGVSDEGVLAA